MQSALIVLLALGLGGQSVADVRQLYNAGRYQDAAKAGDQASGDSDQALRVQFLAAQSYTKLNDGEGARRTYQRLADRAGTPWSAIGRSGLQMLDNQLDPSLESANEAVQGADALPEAHYQRGLVLMARRDYGEAAAAFTRATQLDATFATAYYYAGLANYRAKRVDLMTNNFATFVKLAPNAPERPEVESILRTVRGK
jgi:tetratricopeptide (TPR) repeat protein